MSRKHDDRGLAAYVDQVALQGGVRLTQHIISAIEEYNGPDLPAASVTAALLALAIASRRLEAGEAAVRPWLLKAALAEDARPASLS